MQDRLFQSQVITNPGGFTSGIEGPACDKEGNLYAVNYARRHTIGQVAVGHGGGGESSLFVELPEGSTGCGIRFNRQGDMLIADHTGHNVLKVNMATREVSVYAHESSMNQPNDLAITDDGVLFASDPNWREKTGQLWRIDRAGQVTLMEEGMGTTNGIEVSPDGSTLYVNETVQRTVWAYDILPSYELANKRLFHQFQDFGLDGMRCDMEGFLYVTRYGKGTIARLSPEGQLDREIELTGKNCTNLTFGGADGRTCYVTLADDGTIEMFRVPTPGRCWALWPGNREAEI